MTTGYADSQLGPPSDTGGSLNRGISSPPLTSLRDVGGYQKPEATVRPMAIRPTHPDARAGSES